MRLDMLLQILRSLKRFAAKVTFVWLQRHVHTNVRRDVIALDSCGSARVPLASQVQVVSAFTADMALADMLIKEFCLGKPFIAGSPPANKRLLG